MFLFLEKSCLLLLLISHVKVQGQGSPSSTRSYIPYLYLGPKVNQCSLNSAEEFYREVAFPSLSNMQQETNGFFGLLMDKLELSISDVVEEERKKLEESWLSIMETIQDSLKSTFSRVRSAWGLLVSVQDTQPMPWELSIKKTFLKELINDVEYQYAMLGAIIKAGVKEIVGTLQHQVVNVIKEMETHISNSSKDDEELTELKLLKKMEKSFKKMKRNFIGNLMKRIVETSLASRGKPLLRPKDKDQLQVFFSPTMQQSSIVFKSYKDKGHLYPKYWTEITELMRADKDSIQERSLDDFLLLVASDEDVFINNVFAILTSTIKIQ